MKERGSVLMVKNRCFVIGLVLLGAWVVISCDDFFSSSWGTGSARIYEASKIEVTANNADDWVEKARGNPELAEAVTEAIKQALDGKVKQGDATKDQAKLQEAGVALALEASGVGPSILGNAAGAVTGILDDGPVAIVDLMTNLQSDFDKKNGAKAARNLCLIVNGSLEQRWDMYQSGDLPGFSGLYAENAKAADVGQAVVVLTLALVGKPIDQVDLLDLQEYGISVNSSKKVKLIIDDPTNEAVVLAAYLNLIADDKTGKYDNDPLTSAIKSAFGLG
jgi:hypothetical protein